MVRLLSCLMILAWWCGAARAEPVDAGRAVVDLVAERTAVVPGDRFFAALSLDMDDGWHVYWRYAGDAGIPPLIKWDEATVAARGEFIWPAPYEIEYVPGEIMDYGYNDSVLLPFEVTVPEDASGEIVLSGLADYLICADICIPESARISLTLPVAATPGFDQEAGAAIAGAVRKAPIAFE
ncbi:MAG: protein-disulfide reductase DsbD domain-containing protein, partial [Pseudomonadota bacterium]